MAETFVSVLRPAQPLCEPSSDLASGAVAQVVLMTALVLVVGWLTGYLRLLDETSAAACRYKNAKPGVH